MRSVTEILQGYVFPPEEFFGKGRGKVVSEAVALCLRDGQRPDGLEKEVTSFLDRFCRQKILSAAVWSRPWRDITDGAVVSVAVGPDTVEAEVGLSPKMIRIRLLRPFSGVSASVVVPPIAPRIFTESTVKGARASDYGKQRIRELVIDLFLDRLPSRTE